MPQLVLYYVDQRVPQEHFIKSLPINSHPSQVVCCKQNRTCNMKVVFVDERSNLTKYLSIHQLLIHSRLQGSRSSRRPLSRATSNNCDWWISRRSKASTKYNLSTESLVCPAASYQLDVPGTPPRHQISIYPYLYGTFRSRPSSHDHRLG